MWHSLSWLEKLREEKTKNIFKFSNHSLTLNWPIVILRGQEGGAVAAVVVVASLPSDVSKEGTLTFHSSPIRYTICYYHKCCFAKFPIPRFGYGGSLPKCFSYREIHSNKLELTLTPLAVKYVSEQIHPSD